MKSYQISELEKVTWPFDWMWLVKVMSRTDIWLDFKLRIRTNSELLLQKIEIIAKKRQSSGVTFWPRPWRYMLCLRKKINVKKMLFKVKRNRKTKRKKNKDPSIVVQETSPNMTMKWSLQLLLFSWLQNNYCEYIFDFFKSSFVFKLVNSND